jgi:predicted nucleic acid-binding protein
MNALIPCVIDASVLIKLFLQEEHTADVRYLIQCYLDEATPSTLAVPDLVYIECANILWKKARKQVYTVSAARQSLAQLRLLTLPTTTTSELMERAIEIACAHDVTAYDACYVTLAEKLKVLMLTADAKLVERLDGSPFSILTIQGYLDALPT